MNNDIFENAFNLIDDEFIAEAKSPQIRIIARRKKIIISSVAACIAAVLVAIPSIKIISNLNGNNIKIITEYETVYEDNQNEQQNSSGPQNSSKPQSSDVADEPTFTPPYTDITLTVNDLFNTGTALDGSTTSYTKTYVPSAEYLYINSIPNEKYVTIYEYFPTKEKKHPTEQELRAIAEKYLPKFSEAIGIPTPEYIIRTYSEDDIYVDVSTGEKNTYFYISNSMLKFGKPFIYTKDDVPLTIYGETVVIDQTRSDTEIFESLSGIKEKLGKLFGTTFENSTIKRKFSSYETNGAVRIDVFFKAIDNSCSLYITFENSTNHVSDTVSSTLLYNAEITCIIYDTENPTHSISKQVELLPLEKAEEYLSKGYVLSMGGCMLCQAMQNPIDFTDYDYISFSFSSNNNKKIPYYHFYKNIGTSENGNMIFAKTYVPAIEIEGYEEYFENKHANHTNNNTTYTDEDLIEDNGE